MTLGYIARRLGVFIIILWVAATVNFALPRIAPVNPIREMLLKAARFGGTGGKFGKSSLWQATRATRRCCL